MACGKRVPDEAGRWRVRILSRLDERPVGAGVLISGPRVLTCAHVIMSALAVHDSDVHPYDAIRIDFPASRMAGARKAMVRTDGWFPATANSGDLAVLDLDAPPPPEAAAARLSSSSGSAGRALHTFGHPSSAPFGTWAEVRLVGRGGEDPDWIQTAGAHPTGVGVERGYSGAGVCDVELGTVIGLVIAEYRPPGAKVSWMLPMEAAAAYWTPLRDLLAPTRTHRRRLSGDDISVLAESLISIPFMLDAQARQALVAQLSPEMAAAVPYSPHARISALYLLKTCQDYDGGLTELVRAVVLLDPHSVPSRAFQELAERWLDHGDGTR